MESNRHFTLVVIGEKPEEWLEGKANGYKQKTAKLDNVANLVADNMEALLLSFENAIKQNADDEDW